MTAPMKQLMRHNYQTMVVEGRELLFHVPSTSVFEISSQSAKTLREIESGKIALSDLTDEVSEEFASLMIIGVPGSEYKDVTIERFPAKALVLNVASGCNLSCTYCYKVDLTNLANSGNMTYETAVQAIEMFYRESPNRKDYTVTFFGGEPLSNLPLIRQVIAFANGYFQERGAEVKYTMTTNATLLTPAIINELHDSHVDLTVSIDGPEAMHNKTRVFENGNGSYAAVAKNIGYLRQTYHNRVVAARVTLTKGVTDVMAIWDHLHHKLGFKEIGFAPATASDNAMFNLSNIELTGVFESFKELGEHYVKEAYQNRYNGFSNLHRILSDIHEGRKKRLPCGAGVGLISVSHKGTIDLCHRFTGSDFQSFGSVTTGVDKPALGKFLEQRANHKEGDCATCHIRNLCAGGCYHESYVKYNDPSRSLLSHCDTMRDWIDYAITVYARIRDKNPQFFDTYFTKEVHHETF